MLDTVQLFRETNPAKPLAVERKEDRSYYIDFSSVRGGRIIEKLKNKIALFSPNEPTCELFTGHIGCGKSTELLRLKAELEQEGFYVVYFESDQDLDIDDVDIGDILLVIARRVSAKLENSDISLHSGYFQNLFREIQDILNLLSFDVSEVAVGGALSVGMAQITAQVKASPRARDKLRSFLEPQTNSIIDAINHELLEPAIKTLKHHGKKGLVVIVDNLDRVSPSPKPWGRPQPEYLFIDRGEQLRMLNCHLVYTIPLGLRFSNDYGILTQRFLVDPKVLPMVPVKWRDGTENKQGMALLRQMVLARAFPYFEPEQRLQKITEIFDSPETLDRLCCVTGGHVRNVLRFLNQCIQEEMMLPLSREVLEKVIRVERNNLALAVSHDKWELLRQVHQYKKVTDVSNYQNLIRGRLIYEYYDQVDPWFDVNPILIEAKEFQL